MFTKRFKNLHKCKHFNRKQLICLEVGKIVFTFFKCVFITATSKNELLITPNGIRRNLYVLYVGFAGCFVFDNYISVYCIQPYLIECFLYVCNDYNLFLSKSHQ